MIARLTNATDEDAMLIQAEISRLVDMQQRSYDLLKWLADAVKKGFVQFDVAHEYSTFPAAAEAWIIGHYLNIPPKARPSREDLGPFCAFFSTFLTNSFDLISTHGKHLYSPDAHCFCPWCSWLIDAPNLHTKKITLADKRRAQKMRLNALMNLGAQFSLDVAQAELNKALGDRQVFEDASLVAYAYDLPLREKGIANGPAVLALWRAFAWNESGSPRHDFRLEAESIIAAEHRLAALVKRLGLKQAPEEELGASG